VAWDIRSAADEFSAAFTLTVLTVAALLSAFSLSRNSSFGVTPSFSALKLTVIIKWGGAA
jgi:hypothetical protein